LPIYNGHENQNLRRSRQNPAQDIRMIDLYNATTNQLLGSISEADLEVLVDRLEEESSHDRDYYIDAATIDLLADGRASAHLVDLLRRAVGSAEGVEIRWQRR
jgi:hypothetical protein